ncbi:phage baseplate assembly protein V [Algicola sagamiensis]|uniref:phage baseplate assembly protein V n=1 Tax=Algicola sagamiensis TaxID=163869 RepID=UPI000372D388|nr:phage baseplate assembly protein V [Algicola sagamiensis]
MSVMNEVKVLVGGKDLTPEISIISVKTDYQVNGIPALHIKIKDGDFTKQTFELADGGKFEPGKTIEVKAGFVTKVETIFEGIITGQRMGWEQRTFLEVIAHGDAIKMTEGPRTYLVNAKTKDNDLIKKLIDTSKAKSGNIAKSDIEHYQFFSYQQTLWRTMMARVLTNGFVFVPTFKDNQVVDLKGYKPKAHEIKVGLDNIKSYDLNLDTCSHIKTIESKGWDISKQDYHPKAKGAPDGFKSFSKADKVLSIPDVLLQPAIPVPQKELAARAKAQANYRRLDQYQGQVVCVPSKDNPFTDIKLMEALKLQGIGKTYAGEYLITGIRHTYNKDQWLITFILGLPLRKTLLSGWDDVPPIPTMVGKVADYKDDPEKLQRIPVMLKTFSEDKHVWARLLTTSTGKPGKKEGFFFPPKKDEEVLVGFIGQDSRQPVILGSMHNPKTEPPYQFDKNNFKQGIYFKEKNMSVEFDQEKSTMHVVSGKKTTADINDEKGFVFTQDKTTLTLHQDVTLKSGGKVIQESKADYQVKASGKAKIKASKTEIE